MKDLWKIWEKLRRKLWKKSIRECRELVTTLCLVIIHWRNWSRINFLTEIFLDPISRFLPLLRKTKISLWLSIPPANKAVCLLHLHSFKKHPIRVLFKTVEMGGIEPPCKWLLSILLQSLVYFFLPESRFKVAYYKETKYMRSDSLFFFLRREIAEYILSV